MALVAVISSAIAVGLTIGMTAPLVSLGLEARGQTAFVAGLNSTVASLAMLGVGPVLPPLVERFGAIAVMVGGLILSALSLGLFAWFDSVAAWFALRLTLGVGMAFHWVISETWINSLATDRNRGRAVGAYGTLWSLGIALGPVVLQGTGLTGPLPFLTAAGLVAIAAVPPLVVRRWAPAIAPDREQRDSVFQQIRLVPAAFAGAFLSGFAETSVFTLLPLYALQRGFDPDHSALFLIAVGAGGVLLQLPCGWLADRVGRVPVLAGCALGGLLGAVLVTLAVPLPLLLWPLLFVWGGAISGFYTLGLAVIGDQFRGADLARANVAYVMVYTSGMVIGPAACGIALDLWPPHGLMFSLALAFGAFLLLCRSAGGGQFRAR